MSARRRNSDQSTADDRMREKGMVAIFMERHKDNLELLAPIVGAAAGALALEAASQHVAMKKHEIALFGAGFAFLMGSNVRGPARQLAMGAAAGAACYGVVELLRQEHPAFLYKGPKPETTPRETAPPGAMTHADLERSLSEVKQRHQTELAERDRQIAELQGMVRSLLDELRRQHPGNGSSEPHLAPVAADKAQRATVPADERPRTVSTHAPLPPAGEANIAKDHPGAAARNGASLAPEQTAHFAAIYALLTAEERVRVSSMIATATPSTLATVQRDLFAMTPSRAVAHLRRNVFRSAGATA